MWLTGHSLEIIPWRWCAHLRFFSHGEMKQQLRSISRTFCFLVEITEVMNEHYYISRRGKWELWVWLLGSCTSHGHKQSVPSLCAGIQWHRIFPRTSDSAGSKSKMPHTNLRGCNTLGKYFISIFMPEKFKKSEMETCLLWREWNTVRMNSFKMKTNEFALQYSGFIQFWYLWRVLGLPYYSFRGFNQFI